MRDPDSENPPGPTDGLSQGQLSKVSGTSVARTPDGDHPHLFPPPGITDDEAERIAEIVLGWSRILVQACEPRGGLRRLWHRLTWRLDWLPRRPLTGRNWGVPPVAHMFASYLYMDALTNAEIVRCILRDADGFGWEWFRTVELDPNGQDFRWSWPGWKEDA